MTVSDVITCSHGVKFFRFNSGKVLYEHTRALKVAWEMGLLGEEVATISFEVCDGTRDGSQCPSTQKTVPGACIVCEISTVYKEDE